VELAEGWHLLQNEPGVQEVCVGADKSGADKARGAPQRGDRQEMDQAGTEDDIGARLERVGDVDRVEHGEQSDAHRDADMAVADLGADDDVVPADVGVIKRQEGVGQDHEQAAEPADLGEAEYRIVGGGDPLHQVVDGKVDAPGAGCDDREVDRDRPVDALFLSDVVLQHFEYMQDLPEQEQADQDRAVVEVQLAVAGQCP